MDAAEPLSARSRYYISSVQIPYLISTEQEISLHGARNFLARHLNAVSTAETSCFNGGNSLFLWGKYHVYVLKVCCFFTEESIFLETIH